MELEPLHYQIAQLPPDKSSLHPVVVLLHGRGTDENDLGSLVPSFDSRFLIVSIRAPYKFQHGGYTWFDLDDSGNINIDQLIKSRDSILACLNMVKQNYPVDHSKIFLFGFSMGAMMSMVTSLSHPKSIKGVAAHSGLLPQHNQLNYKWTELSALSFFIAHGEYDPIVPVELGREAYKKLSEMNAKVVYREYPISHTISEESLTDTAEWLQKQI
jgi:phospholipase/carboxylesterase